MTMNLDKKIDGPHRASKKSAARRSKWRVEVNEVFLIFYDKNTVKCLGIFPFVIASNGRIC